MSASDKAITLAEKDPDWKKCSFKFVCNCGCKGKGYELLVEPDAATMYCPQCRCAGGWVWD